MEVYFYIENNGSANSGKAFLFGGCEELIELYQGECGAVGAFGNEGNFAGTAICLGDFDGVHLGHTALFETAKKYGKWGVLLFDRSIKKCPLLTVTAEKLRIISEYGADYAVIAEFGEKFSGRSPAEFADFLRDILHVDAVVAGYDYRFGKNAAGGREELTDLCAERGIRAEIIEPVAVDGRPVKSTKIRELVSKGDMEGANRLLGRGYVISGKVVKGFQNGGKMGFPTANIECGAEKLLPPDGVYRGSTPGYDAVVNIGRNPTFNAEERTVEVHIIGYDGDLYGKTLTVSLYEKIRGDIKFDSIDELTGQIQKDIDYVKGRK